MFFFLIRQESVLFTAVSEEISAKTALFNADFAALKNGFFRADQSSSSAVQIFSDNVHR